jgi:magnesium chelatase subunit I
VKITEQEAWTARGDAVRIPRYLREVVEGVAFAARRDKKIDKRSGVSQRLPITALENAVSNAERRAVVHGEAPVVPRICDVYAALPSLTGKFELEYEGEQRGAEQVAREIVREAIGRVFENYFKDSNLHPIVQWFELGGSLKLPEEAPAAELLKQFRKLQGLVEATAPLGMKPTGEPAALVAGCEFILEGLYAHRKISRSEERGYYAEEPMRPEPAPPEFPRRPRRSYQ